MFDNPFADEKETFDYHFFDGIDLDFHAFAQVDKVKIKNILFYKKPNNGLENSSFWNFFYGMNGIFLKKKVEAHSDNLFDYFPSLGNEVHTNCEDACFQAQTLLHKNGYYHTDLYHNTDSGLYYNCTNVRVFKGKFYPIDMVKIIKLEPSTAKKRSHSRSHSRSRSNSRTKSDKSSTEKKKNKYKYTRNT